MVGERLHDFDLKVTEHAVFNVRRHLGDPAFAEAVQPDIDACLMAYIVALDEPDHERTLLLGDGEFQDLALTFESAEPDINRRWEADDRLLRWNAATVMEVRLTLGGPTADAWAEFSGNLAWQLAEKRVRLDAGMRLVWEWSRELRRLLKAMQATAFLPPPAGTFPTPMCPNPPPVSAEAAEDAPETNADLKAAITEIRDMLRQQRQAKEFYSTAEVAGILEKAEFTVREWCRLGQCRAEKMKSYRGGKKQWMVPHDELLRVQNEGPLPVGTHRLPSSED